MKYATGLDKFATKFPRRFMDVGIAEEHAITAAAGLSANGLIPVVAIYSTFLQRAYDQILHDAALCNQHIIIAVDRAGIVGEDGETHQGIFDVGFLSTIPNVKIYSPFSYAELEMCLNKAVYEDDGIVVIRYPKGRELAISQKYENNTCDYSLFTNDSKTLVISYGRVFFECVSAANDNVDLLRLTRLGFDEELLKIICSYENILFVEEACERGSVSEQLGFILSQRGYSGRYIARNLGMRFVKHQTVEQAFEEYKIDSDSIENILKEM
jgi:1-deoxy-D-xylulose-5-phosphate synthase